LFSVSVTASLAQRHVKEERNVFGPKAILLESQEILKRKTSIFCDKTASSIENTTKKPIFQQQVIRIFKSGRSTILK